jgi:rhamnogalacturonyl hydrolase YesR
MLQALVSKGVLTTQEALEVVDKSLDAVVDTPDEDDVDGVAEVAHACLEQVRGSSIWPADLPVIEDPDIWRAAKRLIDKYAEHAALHAAQRADQLMDERA